MAETPSPQPSPPVGAREKKQGERFKGFKARDSFRRILAPNVGEGEEMAVRKVMEKNQVVCCWGFRQTWPRWASKSSEATGPQVPAA